MKAIRNGVFGVWLLAALVSGAILTSWHSVPLPPGVQSERIPPSAANRWRLLHYLSPDCACSRSVSAWLTARGSVPGVDEEVILIDEPGIDTQIRDGMQQSLAARGFRVNHRAAGIVSAEDGVEGVPMLEAVAPDGRIAYRGGYSEHGAIAGQYSDTAILADLRAAKPARELRIFGCATSQHLRRRQDPFGFKN